jgi:hypothetical protein
MYPIHIRNIIPINEIEPDVIHKELMRGINGRKITRIGNNHYLLQEPVISDLKQSTAMVHDITIKSDQLIITSSNGIALVLPTAASIGLLIMFFSLGLKKNEWEFILLPIILGGWIVLPAPFFISYLLAIPSIKELKKRISRIKNSA